MNIFDDRVEFMNPGAFPTGTGPKDFLKRPHSEPVNEKIATALFKSGEMEGWGCGIPDIYELCKEAGMPEPEFDFVTNFVCLTIRFKQPITPYLTDGGVYGDINGPVNGPVNSLVSSLKGSLKDVYMIVVENPGIKIGQVVEIRGKSKSTMKKQLTSLRKIGLIEYRGSDKTGGYYPL